MVKSNKPRSAKQRVKVKDLREAEGKLTGKQMDKVKGGWVWSTFEHEDSALKAGGPKGSAGPK